MALRGRTVTLIGMCVFAVYMFGGGDSGSQRPTTLAPQATHGTALHQDNVGDEEDEEEQLDAAFEDDFIRSANSSQLLARLRLGGHRAVATGQWRKNRKKITPLTQITSVKDEAATTPDGGADGQPPEHDSVVRGTTALQTKTALEWLSDRWKGNGGPPIRHPHVRRTGAGAATLSDLSAAERAAARSERRKRWMAHGSRTLCSQLQRLHGVVPGVTWGSLPQGQRSAWDALSCDAHVSGHSGGIGGGPAAATAASEPPAAGAMELVSKREVADSQLRAFANRAAPIARDRGIGAAITGGEGQDSELTPEAECAEMAAAHRVVARVTWGSLSEELQTRWHRLGCDSKVLSVVRQQMTEAGRTPPPQRQQAQTPPVALPAGRNRRSQRLARLASRGSGAGASSSECLNMQLAHGVRIGQSWGSLPLSGQQRWTRLGCDALVNR